MDVSLSLDVEQLLVKSHVAGSAGCIPEAEGQGTRCLVHRTVKEMELSLLLGKVPVLAFFDQRRKPLPLTIPDEVMVHRAVVKGGVSSWAHRPSDAYVLVGSLVGDTGLLVHKSFTSCILFHEGHCAAVETRPETICQYILPITE